MTFRRQRALVSQRRLGTFFLLSALAHGLMLLKLHSPAVVTVQIPAPELAVALAADHQSTAAAQTDTTAKRRPADSVPVAAETLQVATHTPALSDALTNHLHSLLHESLSRHFIYPPMARRHGWEGRVELLVRLDPEGRLYGMRIVQSSGYPLLDQDALLTLQRIGSIPQARGWLPEQGYATTLPVIYKLTEG